MTDAKTVTTTDGETIHYCSPIEFVTRANARERRVKHQVDLKDFVSFLLARVDVGTDIPNERLDGLIAEYVDKVEPKVSP